nr:hypothetical protein [Tanacetum cinerariifolium]
AIQRQREIVGDLPFGVATEIVQPVLLRAIGLLERGILGAVDRLVEVAGGGDAVAGIVERHLVERTVEPVGLGGATLGRTLLREQRVRGQRQ